MKNYFTFLLLLFTVNANSQEISFEKTIINFGSINQGDSVEVEFSYSNNSDKPLLLRNVQSTCGCISVAWNAHPLNKGEKSKIHVNFRSVARSGPQTKTILVVSNSINSPTILTIQGDINISPISSNNQIDTLKQNRMLKDTIADKGSKQTKLSSFNDVIDIISMMAKTRWSLGVNYKSDKDKPVKSSNVILDINQFINNGKVGFEIEKSYLRKYKSAIDSTFSNMSLIGSSLGQFVYLRNSEVPIRFCSYKETSKIFFITGIANENVYNSYKLTARQRARIVISEFLLPSLKNLKPMLNKEFEYVGLGATFGSKDLTDKYGLTKGEYIAIVVSTKKVRDFIIGSITEDELVETADIISSDSDMITGTKRIKIVLE